MNEQIKNEEEFNSIIIPEIVKMFQRQSKPEVKFLLNWIPILVHFVFLTLGLGTGIWMYSNVNQLESINSSSTLPESSNSNAIAAWTDPEITRRREFVREMALDSWNAYTNYAWGSKALKPETKSGETGQVDSGLTITHALTTLWLMGLKGEYAQARSWILETDLASIQTSSKQVAIHGYLGSLLSSYSLTNDQVFLEKSQYLAESIKRKPEEPKTEAPKTEKPKTEKPKTENSWIEKSPIFKKRLGHRFWRDSILMRKRRHEQPKENTFSLNPELHYLSKLTAVPEYKNILSSEKDGSRELGNLLGLYLQLNGTDSGSLQEYSQSLEKLFNTSLVDKGPHHVYVKEYGVTGIKMSYRKCSLGAILGLNAHALEILLAQRKSMLKEFEIKRELYQIHRKWNLAEQLTETCNRAARDSPTGLVPEWITFNDQGEMIADSDKNYYITPELAQSYFVLWRLTGDRKYRDYAWEFTYALYEHSRVVSGGYRNLVRNDSSNAIVQPAEFIGSTLKYLYLTFSDRDVLPLDQWVFSQAGQPFPILEG